MGKLWRSVKYGVRGFSVWWGYAWGWRPWDWFYCYEACFVGLRRLRDHVAEHQRHVGWEQDVVEMNDALRLWEQAKDGDSWESEDAAWKSLHDHMRDHAKGWWC